MLYRALCAVSIKGDRIERGTIIDLDEAYAASIGSDYLAPLILPPRIEAAEVEKKPDLNNLKLQELVDLAKGLGLSTSGSKADLRERIELHYQSN